MKRMGRIEEFKGRDGQWYFHVRAANGRIVAQSEGYRTKAGMRRGIAAMVRVCVGRMGWTG